MNPHTKKIITFIIFVLVTTALLYAYYNDQKSNTLNSSIEEISGNENISLEVREYITNLEPNAFPHFRQGERVRYVITPTNIRSIEMKEYGIIEYFVQSIERFNKTDCFLIVANLTSYSNGLLQNNVLIKACVDKYGNVLYVDSKPAYSPYVCPSVYREGKNASNTLTEYSFTGTFFFAPWMLSLTEKFRWKGDFDVPSFQYTLSKDKCKTKEVMHNIKCDVSVEGIEIVDNIKCFKVQANVKITEKNDKNEADMTVFAGKIIFWIDVDKRIVIKERIYQENLPVAEIKME